MVSSEPVSVLRAGVLGHGDVFGVTDAVAINPDRLEAGEARDRDRLEAVGAGIEVDLAVGDEALAVVAQTVLDAVAVELSSSSIVAFVREPSGLTLSSSAPNSSSMPVPVNARTALSAGAITMKRDLLPDASRLQSRPTVHTDAAAELDLACRWSRRRCAVRSRRSAHRSCPAAVPATTCWMVALV